ncbi:hypothetical protein F2Q69_00027972 [Brassica cretica]|uniref:Uncharacterized protein n=1 Tax=Brassica cretica TaxID=69181 RepID=A0A8S9RV11_BRACR|nr:hypothetical protein F2Q69_00027972 [Brassica cretica]
MDIPTENEILGISRGRGNTKFGFLGIYRRNSEEISIRRNIPRKFRGKMCSSEKTDEFRGNIIAVGEPLGDFTKFRGNSDELAVGVGIPSEFPRSSVCRKDLNYKYKQSSSSSFTPYLHPPSYSIYTRI